MSDPTSGHGSELRLRDLGRDAEYAVDLPDLGSLQRRGRAMRFRRQAAVVAAAFVVAATSVFLFQDRSQRDLEPAPPADPRAGSEAFPAGIMQVLEAGKYEITTSYDAADPTVVVTLPADWNAAEGPNRFEYQPGVSQDMSWGTSPWSVGMLALKVTAVASQACQPDLSDEAPVAGFAQTVQALSALPGAESVGAPRDESRFGYPATRLRFTIDPEGQCEGMSAVFESAVEGRVGIQSRTALDVWAVDVGGSTVVIVAGTRGPVPQQYADELDQILDSVRFYLP